MTCIVGLVHNGITYIGADSLGSNGFTKLVRKDKKVFKTKDTDNAIIGFTTSYRMGQLLMYSDGLIDEDDGYEINHEYIVTRFVPKVIKLFEDGGFGRDDSDGKAGGTFLLGYKDKLYKIDSDYQVEESSLNFSACGSGEYHAMGSLYTTEMLNMTPEERIFKALECAEKFTTSVQRPFYIMNTRDNKIKTMN